MDEDYYRAEFKKIDQQLAKLHARRKYELEHKIVISSDITGYQLRRIGRCWDRLVAFMLNNGISLYGRGNADEKPDP